MKTWIVALYLGTLGLPVLLLADEPAAEPRPAATAIADGEAEKQQEKAEPSPGTDLIATINGVEIPYSWFLNEFRSSFFRYTGSDSVRQEVFDSFMERMILYAMAKKDGVDQEPSLKAEIVKRVAGMKEFMEYQLAMAEVGMVVDSFLKEQNLVASGFQADDDEVHAYYTAEYSNRPGAPSSLGEAPAAIRRQMQSRASMDKFQRAVSEKVAEWKAGLEITVQQDLIDNIPMPELRVSP